MNDDPMVEHGKGARLAPGPACLDWTREPWPRFAGRRYEDGAIAILPVLSLVGIAPDLPLNTEEQVMGALLDGALLKCPAEWKLRVLPPFRFGFRGSARHFFGMGPDAVHQQLESIAGSVRDSGFAKLVFINADVWNEALVDAAARDNRIRWGLQTFCIHLSGLGMSFGGTEGETPGVASARSFLAGESGVFKEAALQLRVLLEEIRDRPPLSGKGAIPRKEGREK